MSKRTGEVTEDYATYIKHLLQAFILGGCVFSVFWAIGVWTNWYTLAVAAIGNFLWVHWYFTAGLIAGIIGIVGVVALAYNGQRRKVVRN